MEKTEDISKLRSNSIRARSSKIQSIHKNPLEIIPSEVVFKDIQINQYYEITVQIRNLTQRSKRIRIQQPSNTNFTVHYVMQPQIAPGLSMIAKIKYQCKELKNQTEMIKVLCDEGSLVELPVRVYKTESQILFEPFINFGFVKVGKTHQEVVAIKNIGKATGTIQFQHDHGASLVIEPKVLRILPKEQAKITIKYKATDPGLFKGSIVLKSESILVKDKIDIHATSVQFARFVVDGKGAQNSTFDFGTLYVGQQMVMKGFVVNNSPKKMSFKSIFRKGYLVSPEEFALVQTPAQIGIQQSQRVMFMQPQIDSIEPFKECEVRFICRTKAFYKDRVYTKSFALTSAEQEGAINSKKNSADFKPQNLYEYSAMLLVENDQPIIIQLKALATCPQIKLQNDLFQFGDCELKDTKQAYVTVQNKSNVSKAEITFQKIPNFSVIPSSYTLRPLQSYKFKLQFQPKSIGKFDVIQKLLINKIYEIDIRFFGIATPEVRNKTKVIQDITDLRTRQPIKTRVKAFSVLQKSFVSEMRRSTQQQQRMKLQLSGLIQNKEKFNKVLIDRRSDRIQKQKDEAVQKKWSLYQTKLKDLGPRGKYQETLDQEGIPTNPPIDYEFQSGMNDTKIGKQKIPLPEVRQKLFVTKHINDYEPLQQSANRQIFNRSVTQAPKTIFSDIPINYNHRREIISQLSPNELALVQISSNSIQFGQVYIKSKQTRYFWVRNSTKKAISVQIRNNSQQLANSYKKAQIIKTGQQAGFEIVFCRDTLGDFKSNCKYIINGQHQFEMSVVAKCVPVQIQISTSQLKFQFDQSNLQITTQKKLTIFNPGNSSAFFKFLLGKQKYFTPKIMQGTLKSKQKMNISVSLTVPVPTAKKNQYNYTERLVLKVLDGAEASILCSYNVQDPKYTTKCDAFLNKPILCIGHNFEDGLDIKNTSKNSLVIHLQSTGNLTLSPNKIKLSGQEIKKINLKFEGKTTGQSNTSIIIKPRGGQKKVIQSVIKVIQPQITFSQQYLNMGVLIVQGISGLSKFTLINKNQIALPLIIDIRSNTLAPQNSPNIENISLKLLDQEEKLQILKPVKNSASQKNQTQGQNLVGQSVDQEQLDNSQSEDEQQIIQKNESQYRKYQLLLKPSKIYTFQTEFFPKQTGKYQFQIPMYIQNSIKVQNTPLILAEAIKPQFIFEPSVIDFKRKIVTKPDRCYPKYISVSVRNIDDEDVNWTLDDSSIRKQGIFQIQQNKGLLKAGQQITIKASFNPYIVGQYFHKLPLFIQSKKILEPLKYVDVVFKGSASLPNIFFNKREVIMPVVPLGIETHSSFRIINDGYQNCNLKYQFLDDVAGINVKLHFPQGPNVGITRQKLRVDLIWSFNKPMSFCLKLQFTDDMNRSFVIPVSGTTDNCIFTNYTYFLRNQNKFQIKAQNTLQLVQVNENASSSFSLQRKYSSHSLKSNATNKSVMSYLGVAPINQTILANTIDYINRYLNANLLTTPITDFPGSFIESDGVQIFQIIAFVSAKNNTYPWKYNGNFKGIERANKLFEQYNELIRMLKIQGAHLNHIRPQYLLSFTDLNTYLANLPQQKSKSFMPSLMKINHSLFNYLSMQAWITLLYQIFKIYVLSRVNAKNFKSHIGSTHEIPKIYLDQSNFVSVHQNILFYWVEQAINQVLLEERRFTNFDKDFKDGVAIGALLKKYANVQVLKRMKMICQNQEDFKQNANILCGALSQIGLLNHLTPKDIYSPLQREMLLFILHLYVYLPFYVPKQEPVVFKCILGEQVIRTIELTNPSNKVVNYSTKYEGSQDFKLIGEQKFKIEPKQTYKFEVKFVSRVSAQVKGRIMFINIKDQSLTAAPLVFDLKSQISGRISDRIWNISGTIYEQIEFSIDVSNKFTSQQMVDFAITYQTEYIFQNNKTKNKNSLIPLAKQEQIQTIYGKADNVKIRKNGSVSLTLNYIPTSLYTTRTIIYFLNPIVGEFQHQIIAVVEPPSVSGQIRPPMQLTVDQVVNWQYNVNPKNQMINRAKKTIQSLKKKKGQQNKELPKTEVFINQQYTVQISPNPYVSAKQSIKINEKSFNPQEKAKDLKRSQKEGNKSHNQSKLTYKQKEIVDMENKIPFTIVCKNPVYQFTTFVLLYNKSKTDVRRYKVVFTVQPKPLKAILQMNVPARSEVTQNLPVVNNTDRDWTIKILWQPDANKNGNYFQVPSQYSTTFPVKKNSVGNFPITFKPKWVNKAQAKLIMTNPLTLDHFQYEIIGNGQEPVAQEHIQIRCQAKQRIKKQIYVKNPYSEKPITLRVETDLLNCQSAKKIVIPSGGKQKFQFYVQPMLCGQYTGSITLFEEDGPQYIWYTISVITNFPQVYKTINISSQIRSKQLEKIYIPYTQSKQNTFQVIINGSGLSGQESITAKPNQDNFYLLQYLPLEVGQQKGSVCFINNDIGEVLYEFNLKCVAKPPVIINDIKSPLGVSTIIITEFQNPTDKKTTVNVINSNPQQFVLKSNTIKLGPNQTKKIEIQYIPASLQKIQSAHIQFLSNDIGGWIYQLSGTGLQPVPFQPTIVYNGLMEEHSQSVKFRNPFKYQITIGIKLIPKGKEDNNIFKLLNTAKNKFSIDSFGVLEIPFSFIPIACSKYECSIIAMISQKIFWTFPIVGVTQINTGKTIANLIIPCRQSTSSFAQITLEGVQNYKINNEYSYKLQNIPAVYQNFIQKNLLIDCPKKHLNHAKDGLQFDFNFKPMKPVKFGFDFIVIRKQGSRWRFRVNVQGTQPEADDIIEIQSNLLVTTTVSFKITNSQKVNAPFKAKFTSDSAHEFSVQPKEGTLAKFGSKGTNFFVSFTPVQYGKQKRGKLIIQTNDMYWSYILKGSLPKYVPPQNQHRRSRISSSKQ